MTQRWQRPKTTRRYIHPPMSERLYTIWCEGKVIFGENIAELTRKYGELTASGIWFVRGEGKEIFDFKNGTNLIPENGIPHHGLKFCENGLTYTIEAVSECTAVPACLVRIRVENNGTETASDLLSYIVRTGNERSLVWGAPDVYNSYAPDIDVWKKSEACV